MKETQFIEQNKEKWADYENMLEEPSPDAEKIYRLFYSISDDLAYARSHYPNRSVRVYLNNLARNLFRNVYSGRKTTFRSALDFWKADVPMALYNTRYEQLAAFLVFLIAALIGIVSCLSDDQFAASILGKSYVRMTLENIHNGKPMAVYDEDSPFTMFFAIASNNLKVCYIGFSMGIMGGLGTLYMLLYNGIMVGTFQFFFAKYNLLWSSFLTIWMHGALEISSIVIGSGAGFTIGKGLLFPGTYSRLQSLLLAARRAITIMIGISPVIVVAAYIESFLTRHYDMHEAIKLALILASFGFILFYFVIYPFVKGRSQKEQSYQADGLTYLKPVVFDPKQIYNAGQISGFSLRFFGNMFEKTGKITLVFSLLYTALVAALQYQETIGFELVRQSGLWYTLFYFTESASAFALHLFFTTCLVLISCFQLFKQTDPANSLSFPGTVRRFGIPAAIVFATISALFLFEGAWKLLYVLILPGLYAGLGMILVSKESIGTSVGKSWEYMFGSFGKSIACFLIFMLLGLFCIILTGSPMTSKVFDLIYWNMSVSNSEITRIIFTYLPTCIGYGFLLITAQLLVISSCILAFSLIETNQAGGLLKRIRTLQNE
jgi:uncharacterized membrane protein SpoIIM required for sporulation